MKKIAKTIVAAPIVLIWDTLYMAIKFVYDGATWIDKKGGDLLQRFMEE